jgi:hypothetical protein
VLPREQQRCESPNLPKTRLRDDQDDPPHARPSNRGYGHHGAEPSRVHIVISPWNDRTCGEDEASASQNLMEVG